jgi:hypothetical protein
MRKCFWFSQIAVLFFLGGLFFFSGTLLEKGSLKALDYLASQAAGKGFELIQPEFRNVEFLSARAVAWNDVSTKLKLRKTPLFSSAQEVFLKSARIVLSLESIWERTFLLTVEEMNLAATNIHGKSQPIGDRPALGQIEGRHLTFFFQLDFLKPWETSTQLSWIFKNIVDLLNEGRSSLALTFSGVSTLWIRGKPFTVELRTELDDYQTIIIMDETDVRVISQKFDLLRPLTLAEVKLLSRNPLRAPRLLKIKQYARKVSTDAHLHDPAVPKDAFRHVLWSYLLTKEYGADFAMKVTDAHEEGRTENTRDERLMDINNNRIGRNYAKSGHPETSLLAILMYDPEVISSPGQVVEKLR